MTDAEVRMLRKKAAKWADAVSYAEEVMMKAESVYEAHPVRLPRAVLGVVRFMHRLSLRGEAQARAAARATYWGQS